MKIAIFLHGTLLMHQGASGQPREIAVKQVMENERSVLDYASYIPIGMAAEKLRTWNTQGVEIVYISSHQTVEDVEKDKLVLQKYDFPAGEVLFRDQGQSYQGIIEKIMPDILIEDDCESIGGQSEMIYPNLSPELKSKIKSIVVKEFKGIDGLPDKLIKN